MLSLDDDERELWEERAGILEFDGEGMPRALAERIALGQVRPDLSAATLRDRPMQQARRRSTGIAPELAIRLAEAHANGEGESIAAYRAALKAAGYAARVAAPAEVAEAVRDWPRRAAEARRDGLDPALIVPIPGRAEPLFMGEIGHLRRDPPS